MKSRLVKALVLAGSLLLQLSALSSHLHAAAGDVDLSFNAGLGINSAVKAVAVQPDGKVLIGDPLTFVNGPGSYGNARLGSDGGPDTTFMPTQFNPVVGDLGIPFHPSFGDYVTFTAFALQPDGKVLIAGVAFHYECDDWGCVVYDGYFVTRHHADGSRDTSFAPALGNRIYGGGETVASLAVQSDGKILVGGYFKAVNGTDRNGIARLNADGTLDTSSSLNISGEYSFTVTSLAAQSDGKFFIGGRRYHYDGSLDNAFTGVDGVNSVVLQPDGKVLIGGTFTMVHGTSRHRIARLHADGSLDTSFDPGTGADATVRSIALQADGEIVIGGDFLAVNETYRNRVARLEANGSLDGGFDPEPGVERAPTLLALQPDGKVLLGNPFVMGDTWWGPVGGTLAFVNGGSQHGRMRLRSDGRVDRAFVSSYFNPPLTAFFHTEDCPGDPRFGCTYGAATTSHLVEPDGKVLLGGYSVTTITGDEVFVQEYHPFLARFNASGGLETRFDHLTANAHELNALARQPDGKILLGGWFYGEGSNYGVVRILADGTVDDSFNSSQGSNFNYGDRVTCLALQADGKVLIGGGFGLARLNSDGSREPCFNPELLNGAVNALIVQPDGRIIAGGSFTVVNGIGRNGIARLNVDGSLDGSFNPGSGANGPIHSLVLQPDGNILIGGNFAVVNGVTRPYVARLLGNPVPPLRLFSTSPAAVVAAWPTSSAAFTLQRNADLATPNWEDVTSASTTVGGEQHVALAPLGGAQFFRLSGAASPVPAYPVPPPIAPRVLTAIAGDRQTTLSWTAFPEAIGHRVQRATSYEGPYVTIANPITNTHTDTDLANGVAYYYIISTTYACGESAGATPVRIVPQPPPPSVHVQSITMSWVNSGGGYKARAVVKVVDDAGVALGDEEAAVIGNFSGAIDETDRFGYSNQNGNATITSASTVQNGTVTFTVTVINASGAYVYNAASNVVTSASISR